MKNHSKSKLKEGEVFRQFDVLQPSEGGDFEALNFRQAQTLIEAQCLI
jgi:hypothetical protein